jgi:methylglyoxal synthase
MATVAFVIDSKNEEDTIKALSGCKSQLAGAKILATRTEKNKIEGILDTKKVNITYVTSLDVQGEKTILAKAQRKEIAALFYISPNTEQSFLPRFVELLSTAVKSHVLIALNQETAEAIVNYLHGTGGAKFLRDP